MSSDASDACSCLPTNSSTTVPELVVHTASIQTFWILQLYPKRIMLSLLLLLPVVAAFAPSAPRAFVVNRAAAAPLFALERMTDEDGSVPIPFVECNGAKFIECFADSKTTIDGTEYTVGVPCDNAVAICYFDEDGNLLPVELDDELMNDVFPIAEAIVTEEFGEELSLERTPQTLTLVGELDDDEDEDEGG
jgi:hypothetical protein